MKILDRIVLRTPLKPLALACAVAVGMVALAVNPASASLVYTQEFDGTGAPGSWTGWSVPAGKTFVTNGGGHWGDSTNAYLATPHGTPSLYEYAVAVTCDFSQAVPAYGNMVSGNTYTVDLLSDHPSVYWWNAGCLISLVDLTTMVTLSSVNVPAGSDGVWETITLTATAGAGNATHPLGLVIDATRGDGFAQIAEVHLSVAIPPGAATTTLVTTSGSPSTEGVSVTLTATVDPVPTGGTVQFYDNSVAIGAAATVDTLTGIATLATSDLSPGIHPITATYSGTSGFFTSTSSVVNQEVTEVPKVPTATVVTTSGSPSTFGASVTLTATVDPVPTGGTVQFYDDSVAIGAAASVNTSTGKAILVTTTLTVGSHPITATYSGTIGFATSTASVVTQEVTEAPTTTVVTTSGSPSTFRASVTLTATVDPVPTGGTVQFYDDSVAIGAAVSVNTSTGKATLVTTTLTVGSHPITATYSGTIGFATSTTATGTTQIVNPASASLVYTQEFDGTGAPGSWTGWSATSGKTFVTNSGGNWGDSTNAYLATPNGTPSLYEYDVAVTCDFSQAVPAYGNMVSGNAYTVDLLSDHPSVYPWNTGCLISLVDLTTMETLSSVNVPAWSAANDNVWETLTLTATAGAGNATHPLGLVIDATRSSGFAQIAEVKLNVVPTGPPVETTTVVTGNGTSTVGTSVTLTATVSPSPTGGTVQFHDNTTTADIGTPQPVIGGIATVGADLTVGTHSIIATFSGTSAYAVSVSTAVTQIVNPLQSAYDVWSTQITNGKVGATQDADADAVPNFIEFAFNGNPMSAASAGMIHALTETSANHNNNKVLVLTIAVRTGTGTPADWAANNNTATIDGITYTIEGGTTLGDFSPGDGKIFACETAIITGLPLTPGDGYEWRSFILNSSESLGGKGFLRAKVVQD